MELRCSLSKMGTRYQRVRVRERPTREAWSLWLQFRGAVLWEGSHARTVKAAQRRSVGPTPRRPGGGYALKTKGWGLKSPVSQARGGEGHSGASQAKIKQQENNPKTVMTWQLGKCKQFGRTIGKSGLGNGEKVKRRPRPDHEYTLC